MTQPAITVVVPAWNRARTIRGCLDSVLAQDFADFEIVVVDDGSTDGTADVVESVADGRVRTVRLPANRGHCAARNAGIRAARAPLICFLDSDDRFLPHKLGFVAQFFAAHPEIDVLIDSFEVFFPAETGRAPAPRHNPELRDSAAVESAVFRRELWKATPAVSARREALFAAGLFDETLHRRVDMDFVLRLTRAARCASTSSVLWCKHWTDDSVSAANDTFIPALLEICRRHPQYVTRSEWRGGLARDIARHLLRQAGGGYGAQLVRDLGRLRGHFGLGAGLRLVAEGVGEIISRGIGRDRAAG